MSCRVPSLWVWAGPIYLLLMNRIWQKWEDITLFLKKALAHPMTCGISVPEPVTEPVSSALEARSLNHWTKPLKTLDSHLARVLSPCLVSLVRSDKGSCYDGVAQRRDPRAKELRAASSHQPARKLSPSVRQPTRNWILPMATWVSLEADPPQWSLEMITTLDNTLTTTYEGP